MTNIPDLLEVNDGDSVIVPSPAHVDVLLQPHPELMDSVVLDHSVHNPVSVSSEQQDHIVYGDANNTVNPGVPGRRQGRHLNPLVRCVHYQELS